MTKEAEDKLGCIQAVFEAITGKAISFFPRVDDDRAPGEMGVLDFQFSLSSTARRMLAVPLPGAQIGSLPSRASFTQ